MTTAMLEREEALDLSDLDLLDDTTRHIFCDMCTPPSPCIADTLCGTRAFSRGGLIFGITPDLCPGCVERVHACPRCGR